MRILLGSVNWELCELDGTPREIVAQMKAGAEGVDHMSLLEYIDWVAERALTYEGVRVEVEGVGEEARAASLLRALIDEGLAFPLEGDGQEAA
jgi:hypothetical protein